MKPFQFYLIKDFRRPAVGGSLQNEVQMTFSGEAEDVRTVLTLKAEKFEGPLDFLRVKSEIRHQTFGFIKTMVEMKRHKIDFAEYLEPVDFPAYFDTTQNLMIFQAPKKVCRGVLQHLKKKPCGITLAEVEVDFVKVMQLTREYFGVWFKGVSTRVQAAALSGNQIQEDSLFKTLQRIGSVSNLTIPWVFGGAEHHVMLTSRGGVILVQNYQDNIGLELQLVMDIQKRLLQKVWHERKSSKEDDDVPGEP
jgi:hypothetical protein